jgi:hypothetical protein
MGYNNREKCVQFLHSTNAERDWKDVKIMIFDSPQVADKPYSQRLAFLQQGNKIL